MRHYSQLAFTPAVKAAQERLGSRVAQARLAQGDDALDALGEDEIDFLSERDSFYMATVGESGWPYIQHRGGPPGFVHVLDEHTLAFADRKGNRQYISVGNLAGDDRVALIFVDYPSRTRLKILARAKAIVRADDPELFTRIAGEAPADHVMVLKVEGLDWNCPKHITPRYTEAQIREMVAPLLERVKALEAEVTGLRGR